VTKLREIEVEPLSEQRWSKIERSLFMRLEHESSVLPGFSRSGARTWRFRWVAAAAAAAALTLVAVLLFVDGSSRVAEVDLPSRITTGRDSSHLALPGLSVDVGPESAVVVGPETSLGMLIVVDRGGIVCEVAPRPSGAPVIVQAGAARVRVLGTRFSVNRRGESARVTVEHGVVEVSAHGRSARVHAGEEWPATDPAPLGSVDPAPVSAADQPMPESVRRSVVPPERPGPAPRLAQGPASPPVAEDTRREPSPQAVFEQAAALERRDPAKAAQLYRSLEGGSDSWAKNALYARARLEASRGNRGEARRSLERYLDRFPRGENAEDARAVLERLR
jgi:hypothetical protein